MSHFPGSCLCWPCHLRQAARCSDHTDPAALQVLCWTGRALQLELSRPPVAPLASHTATQPEEATAPLQRPDHRQGCHHCHLMVSVSRWGGQRTPGALWVPATCPGAPSSSASWMETEWEQVCTCPGRVCREVRPHTRASSRLCACARLHVSGWGVREGHSGLSSRPVSPPAGRGKKSTTLARRREARLCCPGVLGCRPGYAPAPRLQLPALSEVLLRTVSPESRGLVPARRCGDLTWSWGGHTRWPEAWPCGQAPAEPPRGGEPKVASARRGEAGAEGGLCQA